MTLAITLASRWSNSANRRREGLRAAHAQDADTLVELMHTYLRLKSGRGGRISDLTLRHYEESVRRFLEFTGPAEAPCRALNQLESEDFEVWLLELQGQGLSPNSVKRHLYGVRNLMKALVWAEALKADPSAGVRPPSDPTPAHTKKGAIPVDTYRELLALPHVLHGREGIRANRDLLLLVLGGGAGLRAAEIVGLDVEDVDLSLMQLRVRGKGGKVRHVPMSRSVQEAVRGWLSSRRALELEGLARSVALLVSVSGRNYGGRLTTKGARDVAEGYYKAVGLPPRMWGLHTLRRTAGTHLYRATRDLHVVADVLGHASVSTSAIYAKMDVDVRREAMEKMEDLRGAD